MEIFDNTEYNEKSFEVFEREVLGRIKSSYSKEESLIVLYISLCEMFSYDDNACNFYNCIETRTANLEVFMEMMKYFLVRLDINCFLNQRGDIIVVHEEYEITIPNNQLIISSDMETLFRINGLIPSSELEITNDKFVEKCSLMVKNMRKEEEEVLESEKAIVQYQQFVTQDLLFSDRLRLFLQQLSSSYVKGIQAKEEYTDLFNRVFKPIDNVEIRFLYDHELQDKVFDYTPLVVIKLNNEKRYLVIDSKKLNYTKMYSRSEFYEYINGPGIEVLDNDDMKLGETDVRKIKKNSK